MMNWILGLDVWEGSLDIDEQALKAGGISLLIIRMNSIDGGLHLDENFIVQWEQAACFLRFPYFVYNPWVSGRENFEWMIAHLPKGVKRVAVDVEVRKEGYKSTEYAANVQEFINLCVKAGLWPVVYTGQWFLSCLSSWPKTEYWWARYPFVLYPEKSQRISWDGLKALLETISWNPYCNLGTCRLWQCSGDRFKPYPGCQDRVVDINLWHGTLEELREWVGEIGAPPVKDSWQWDVTLALRSLNLTVRDP